MTTVVDWARVYDYARDEALEQRLQIWLDIQRREKREVTKRRFGGLEFIFSRDGSAMDDITNQSDPPPGVLYLATDPVVIEPDQEPDDDTEAEVPDVREDTVNDD